VFLTLEIFTVYREGELSLEDVTRLTGLPMSTAFRLLRSLERSGYLEQNKDSGLYSLWARFFDLAKSTLPYNRLISIVRPYLNSLMLSFAESVNSGVYEDGLVAHIFTVDSPQGHRVSATVGNRGNLHSTSMGKALAAYMDRDALQEVFLRYGLPPKTDNTLTSERAVFEELGSDSQDRR
jgi:DNA-binding IclR family transcriptional regulator